MFLIVQCAIGSFNWRPNLIHIVDVFVQDRKDDNYSWIVGSLERFKKMESLLDTQNIYQVFKKLTQFERIQINNLKAYFVRAKNNSRDA